MSNDLRLTNLITPTTEDEKPDQRLHESMGRILKEIGPETAGNLLEFAETTAVLQRNAAADGLKLAMAIFNEAFYLENNHSFDDRNLYGWKSKRLRKQAQQILENVGFKSKNAHKLITTADWLTRRLSSIEEHEWFNSLTASHLYELSRMTTEAYEATKREVSYKDFHFSAGQKAISVRRMEALRQMYSDDRGSLNNSKEKTGSDKEALGKMCSKRLQTTGSEVNMVDQFISVYKAIEWNEIRLDHNAMQALKSIEETLSQVTRITKGTG